VEAVVIAGNRARTDVALRPNLRVAQVREMHGFGAFADGAFLEFHEIADTGTGFQVIVRPQSGERADNDAVIEAALRYHAMRLDGYVVAKDGIRQDAARSNDAARADFVLPSNCTPGSITVSRLQSRPDQSARSRATGW